MVTTEYGTKQKQKKRRKNTMAKANNTKATKEFTYEVLATYAEMDGLKVRSVSFNDREPKFDIRHWTERKGEEAMGKGVTLTIEELKFLATKLPKVYAELTGGATEEEPEEETADEEQAEDEQTEEDTLFSLDMTEEEEAPKATELDERAQKLIKYIIDNAPDAYKGVNVVDGVTYATEGHFIIALNGESDAETTKVDIKSAYNKMLPSELNEVKVDIKALRNATKTRLKKDTMYSFGAKYKVVNADWIGKACRVVGDDVTISTDKNNRLYVVNGQNGTVIVMAINAKEKKVGLIKKAA